MDGGIERKGVYRDKALTLRHRESKALRLKG
jgi:hypothetical protein